MAKSSSPIKTFLSLVVVLAVIGLAYIYLTSNETTDEETIVENGAAFSYIEGIVEVKAPEGEWKRADVSTDLYEGYEVETMGEARAIIQFDDGSAVRMNEQSHIRLTSLDPNHLQVENLAGELYARVTSGERIFEVAGEGVSYEAIGTAFMTSSTDTSKGVYVYKSSVKVTEEGKDSVVVEEGKKYLLGEAEVKEIEEEEKEVEFIKWNFEKDGEPIVEQEDGSITLEAEVIETGIKFSWEVEGIETEYGFKIVKSEESDPVYPGDDYFYEDDPESRTAIWDLRDGKTYYFRICDYEGGVCGTYSDNVQVTAPTKDEETGGLGEEKEVEVKQETSDDEVLASDGISISLSGSGSSVSWSVDGYSEKGFKVVWSKNPGPTYPTRSGDKYQYFSSPTTTSASLTAFDGNGTYYVRVCEYLGGSCGTYSNQIIVELTK